MTTKDINVCSRLGEERKRLHLNQSKVADYCGVSLKTVGRWEKNIPIPADKLALLAKVGYDITYILTSVKLAPQASGLDATSSVWDAITNNNPDMQALDTEQKTWMNILEGLASGDQERIKLIGMALVGYSQASTKK